LEATAVGSSSEGERRGGSALVILCDLAETHPAGSLLRVEEA
jgi:hypothetical protein